MTVGRHAPLIYFDANPLIYAFEADAEVAQPVQTLLKALADKPGAAVTSEIVLAELLAPISRPAAKPPNIRRQIYFNLLIWSGLFDLRPVSREILIDTADLRQFARLKIPDAIHLVTAFKAGCRFFLSNDDDTRQTPRELTRVRPDAKGVQTILDQIG